jgi:hypothetical protein
MGRIKDKESDIMPDVTPNLNLEKPLDNETADIAVINSNMDKIDKPFGVGTGEGHIHNGTVGQGPKISYNDLVDKPTAMTPAAHASTHASGGSDPVTPASIGAETPAGAQAKANAAESAAVAAANGYTDAAVASVQANLIDHKDQDMPHLFEDTAAQKTYKYGFKQQDNHLVFMYQEVV